jgi:3-hydroxyisobutyrate dehydrogenase-like beta-hydroxyacid dehydrogenase|tara:strand:- start:1656 stop:2522 length:867 start_codon:yes stop_codon:yes gene_type:complete
MTKAIGFIGLGVMGFHMAGHLSKHNQIAVFNRTKKKSEIWSAKYNGKICSSPADLAKISDVIILCVGNDDDVRDIVTGYQGLLENIKPGSIIVDHTTTSAKLAKEIYELLDSNDIFYIDAPVSGGEVGAQSGMLSIMAGGNKDAYDQIKSILEPYTKLIKYMGLSGSGQYTKMVNQICIAGLIQALAEGINFSEKVGLDTKSVLEVVSNGAAQSWQMDNRWLTMLDDNYDHGFAVDLMRKDLEIVLDEANINNINIEITKIINEFYKDIQKAGGGKWDTSSLLKRIEN